MRSPRIFSALLVGVAVSLAAVANAVGFEPPIEKTLPNGLKVAVFPRPGAGFVQVQLSVPAGTSREGEKQRGAAQLVAQLLRSGTSSRSAETFSEDLDRLGGTLTSTALREHALAGGAFLPEDLGAGLELMSDAIIHPIFDEASFARARDQAVRELVRLHGDPVLASGEQLWALALAGEPGAREPLGDLVSLFALTRESLREFHGENYRPARSVLAIAGDITPERAFAAATEWFGRWSGSASPVSAAPVAPSPAGTRIILIDRPDRPTATVRLGWRLPGRGASDDLARTLAFDGLDEDLRPRLERALPPRTDLGFEFTRLANSSLFEVLFTVAADSAGPAIERARRTVGRAREGGLEASRAASARARALAAFPLRFDTPGGTVAQWLAASTGSADAQTALASHEERVRALDGAAMNAALKRDWDLERTTVVVIGPAAKLRAGLARVGTVREIKLDVPPSELARADAAAPATDAERKLGVERMKLAIAAHGGLAALRGIRDQVSEAKLRIVVQGRELSGALSQMRKDPMMMVALTSFEGLDSRQVLNGDEAWSLTQGGDVRQGDSVAVAGMQASYVSDLPHLLLAAADTTTQLAARGTVRIGERDVWMVEAQLAQGTLRRMYIDPTSHQVVAMDQAEPGARSASMVARRLFSDMRPVDGLVMPFEEERQLDGKMVMRQTVTRMKFNSGLSDHEFRKPSKLRSPATSE